MSVKLTNNAGGQIVCDLKDKSTLRLNVKQSTTVQDEQITKHIENLVIKGLLLSEPIAEPKTVSEEKTETTAPNKSVKNKKEVK